MVGQSPAVANNLPGNDVARAFPVTVLTLCLNL
jgi:hypothetical protein